MEKKKVYQNVLTYVGLVFTLNKLVFSKQIQTFIRNLNLTPTYEILYNKLIGYVSSQFITWENREIKNSTLTTLSSIFI